jgi:chromosome segregation ATPase
VLFLNPSSFLGSVKSNALNHCFLHSVQYLNELDDLRTQLSSTRATAEASAASAKSAQQQCLSLLKELNEKDSSLKEHELRVNKLGEQLDLLQKDLQARELSQRQLKDEVIRIETDIMDAVAKAGSKSSKDNELLKILSDVSPKNVQNLNNLLNVKATEIARLREEIRILSAHWMKKTKELESQVCSNSFFSTKHS